MAYRAGHSLDWSAMNLPTKITFTRIVLVVLLWVFLFAMEAIPNSNLILGNSGINLTYLIACAVFLVASLSDFLDGYLARKRHEVTDLGKFLDPIADKLLVDSMLIYLTFPRYGNISISLVCVILMIARDLVIDAFRQVAATRGTVLAASYFGKAKTVLQMAALILVFLNGWPFSYFDAGWDPALRIASWFVYLATAISLLSMIDYLVKNRSVLKGGKVENGQH